MENFFSERRMRAQYLVLVATIILVAALTDNIGHYGGTVGSYAVTQGAMHYTMPDSGEVHDALARDFEVIGECARAVDEMGAPNQQIHECSVRRPAWRSRRRS